MTKRSILSTVLFGALTGLAAAIGTVATRRSVDSLWYWRLKKPAFQPPPQVFAPVWTGLYSLIALSGATVWQAPAGRERTRALALWGAQLALSAGWSVTFFGTRRPKLALGEIGLLLGSIVGYGLAARKVDRKAAWLVLPYALWTGFATVLNADIVRKNSSAMLRGWAGEPRPKPARPIVDAHAVEKVVADKAIDKPAATPLTMSPETRRALAALRV